MSEEETKKTGVSRREFLKDAGLVVGGATIGSMAFLSACSKTTTTTATTTLPPVTSIVNQYIDPIDGSTYPTLDALKAHFTTAHPYAAALDLITLNVNGNNYTLQVSDMDTLANVLRDKLGLFGTKVACEMGQCGACTVLVNNVPTFSCLTLAIECSGTQITTIEGLSTGPGVLSPIQQKFYDNDAFQCGYCTGGFIMAGAGLIKTNPTPTPDQVRLAISGHMCVCGNYKKAVDAITGGV